MYLPINTEQYSLVCLVMRFFPPLDQHTATALVQIHSALWQASFVTPDEQQDGAEQWGACQLHGRWSSLYAGIERISGLILIFGSQPVIQGIPEVDKPLEIIRCETLDYTALEVVMQRALALSHTCWSTADDHP